MVTDVNKIIGNLLEFYGFKNKVIVSVGAGGGQLIEYGRHAKKVYAVDSDINAVGRLEENLLKSALADRFEVFNCDFYDFNLSCDVVLFEFCLHEMVDPAKAINHAKTLGANVVIMDHSPDSEWAFYVDEKEKVESSWEAIKSYPIFKVENYNADQTFNNYEELYQKVKVIGEVSIIRIQPFINQRAFSIPMSYRIAWI